MNKSGVMMVTDGDIIIRLMKGEKNVIFQFML